MSNYPITEKFLMDIAEDKLELMNLSQYWQSIENCCEELEITAPYSAERGAKVIRRIMAAFTVKKDK